MQHFTYARAESVTQAVALLNESGLRSRVLAGGTDLLLLARTDPALCDRVVDISLIPDLHRITLAAGRVTIGAAATFTEIMDHPLVSETATVLAQACSQVGAVQVRNVGTIGGNVANAAACADSLPALVCLDAVATVLTPDGPQRWPVADLVLGPNRTRIPPGGLLVSLDYEAPARGSRSVFLKLGRRNAMAISRLTVAALGRLDGDGSIVEARLAAGAATPQCRRLGQTEAVLVGQRPATALFEAAAEQAVVEMIAASGRRWSAEFKEPALAALTARALAQVFGPAA
jgi:CO/xanthine dehydrogenase FAD-binding subunit